MTSQDEWYVIVDDQSPEIRYQGQWFNTPANNAFNGSLSAATVAGSSALFKFHGNYVAARGAILFTNAKNPPVASFSIDGQTPAVFTPRLTDNNTIPATFFVSPQLSDDDHTLNITLLSNGAPFFLDYVLFNASSVAQATVSATVQPTIVTTIVIVPPTTAPESLGATPSSSSVPVGAIVGGVVGGVALIVASLLAFYFMCWRSRQSQQYFYYPASLNEPEHKPSGIVPFTSNSHQPASLPSSQPLLASPGPEQDVSVYSRSSYYPPTEFITSPPGIGTPQSIHNQHSPHTDAAGWAALASTSSPATASPVSTAFTPAQRKAAEALSRTSAAPTRHTDSGYRFDEDQNGSSSGARNIGHDPEVPEELPPSYTEA